MRFSGAETGSVWLEIETKIFDTIPSLGIVSYVPILEILISHNKGSQNFWSYVIDQLKGELVEYKKIEPQKLYLYGKLLVALSSSKFINGDDL